MMYFEAMINNMKDNKAGLQAGRGGDEEVHLDKGSGNASVHLGGDLQEVKPCITGRPEESVLSAGETASLRALKCNELGVIEGSEGKCGKGRERWEKQVNRMS